MTRPKPVPFLLTLAGLAATASAQPIARLVYEASLNGVTWHTTLPDASTGDTVTVRARMVYAGTQSVGGLGQAIFQPLVSSWVTDDRVVTQTQGAITDSIGPFGGTRTTPIGTVPDAPGVYGRLTPWGAAATSSTSYYRGFIGIGPNAGLMRISQAHITNWIGTGATSGSNTINNVSGRGGVNAGQLAGSLRMPSDPAFETRLDVVVFKFAMVLGGALDVRTMTVTTPPNAIGRRLVGGLPAEQDILYYTDTVSTNVLRGDLAVDPCTIWVNVPAPGASTLVGLGAIIVLRRRRPACAGRRP